MDAPSRRLLLDRLADLAYDVSSYLRGHARPAVRISAALLVAASLAACNGLPGRPGPGPQSGSAVQPLSQEVRSGLPQQPGRYSIVANSLARDERGVYHFAWLPLGGSGSGTQAAISRVQLGQADSNVLEIPAQGDPILYLRSNTAVPLVTAGGNPSYIYPHSGGFATWYPFYGIGSRVPSYYDPPTLAAPQGADLRGSRISSAPAPPSDRTVGLPHTVSGRAGGTGSGQAASQKSGAGTGRSSDSSAGASRSGGFSSGHGASAGGSSS